MSMNVCSLVGRLTRDPDYKVTPNGVSVATFTLAIDRPFKNAQGDKETDFINIQTWRKTAENVGNFLKKGSLCGVVGRIQTRSYDAQDGSKRYVTEVLAESVQFLEPKRDGQAGAQQAAQNITNYNNGNQQPQRQSYDQQAKQPSNYPPDPFAGGQKFEISDSDLPF